MQIDPKDSEAHLICCAIQKDGLHKLKARGIMPDSLLVWGEVLRFAYDHSEKYGKAPSIETIFLTEPEFPQVSSDEMELEYLIDVAITHRKQKQIKEALSATIDIVDEDPSKALSHLLSNVREIERDVGTRAIFVDTNPTERLEEYSRKCEDVASGKNVGVRTGIGALDRESLSWIDGDFILVIGPPEAGKSWTVLKMGMAAYCAGFKVMYVSLEMIEEEIRYRWHTLYGRELGYTFSNENLTAGVLQNLEEYADFLHRIGDREDFVFIGDVEGGKFTVPKIEGLIAEYAPKVVIVDPITLLTASDGSPAIAWTALLDVAYGLKFLATRTKTIVIATSTSTGETFDSSIPASLADLGLSKNIGFAPDLALSISSFAKEPAMRNMRIIKKRKGRRMTDIFQMTFDPDVGRIG